MSAASLLSSWGLDEAIARDQMYRAATASVAFRLAWSRWRRRHQARAQRCHYRRRGANADHPQAPHMK